MRACAACLEMYFSQIESLRSATTFVPSKIYIYYSLPTKLKVLYNIYTFQACAARHEMYFSQIDSLRSATIFVPPRNCLLFVANNIISR